MMLSLTGTKGSNFIISDNKGNVIAQVQVGRFNSPNQVRLMFQAEKDIQINREVIYNKKFNKEG